MKRNVTSMLIKQGIHGIANATVLPPHKPQNGPHTKKSTCKERLNTVSFSFVWRSQISLHASIGSWGWYLRLSPVQPSANCTVSPSLGMNTTPQGDPRKQIYQRAEIGKFPQFVQTGSWHGWGNAETVSFKDGLRSASGISMVQDMYKYH